MLRTMKRLWRAWRRLAHGLVGAQNTLLLGVVFLFGLGPTALLAWMGRRRLLDRATLAPADLPPSHWVPLPKRDVDLRSAQRSF
jgi:hypothetical protein